MIFDEIILCIDIIVSILLIISCAWANCFWYKEKDNIRLFVSLKDVLTKIDDNPIESKNGNGKETCKNAIIKNVSYGIKKPQSEIKKILDNLNSPVELESRKLVVSFNFIIIINMMMLIGILHLLYDFNVSFIIECMSENNFIKYFYKGIYKVLFIIAGFLFFAYLAPKIKQYWKNKSFLGK